MTNEILKLSEISFSMDKTDSYIIYGTSELVRMLKRVLNVFKQEVSCFLCSVGYKNINNLDRILVYDVDEYLKLIDGKVGLDKILLVV